MKKIFGKMVRTRRGVSPLIATVLLIAFAVALGAVVMNWSRSFTGEQMETAQQTAGVASACDVNVRMNLVEIGGIERMCYDNSSRTGSFIVKNNGNFDIEGLQVQIITSEGIEENNGSLNLRIGKGKIAKGSFSWTSGTIEEVIITPLIKVNGENVACTGLDREIVRSTAEMSTC